MIRDFAFFCAMVRDLAFFRVMILLDLAFLWAKIFAKDFSVLWSLIWPSCAMIGDFPFFVILSWFDFFYTMVHDLVIILCYDPWFGLFCVMIRFDFFVLFFIRLSMCYDPMFGLCVMIRDLTFLEISSVIWTFLWYDPWFVHFWYDPWFGIFSAVISEFCHSLTVIRDLRHFLIWNFYLSSWSEISWWKIQEKFEKDPLKVYLWIYPTIYSRSQSLNAHRSYNGK